MAYNSPWLFRLPRSYGALALVFRMSMNALSGR